MLTESLGNPDNPSSVNLTFGSLDCCNSRPLPPPPYFNLMFSSYFKCDCIFRSNKVLGKGYSVLSQTTDTCQLVSKNVMCYFVSAFYFILNLQMYICYRTKGLTGSVTINGIDRKTLNYYRKLVCYIMQEDQLMPHLTVLEAMTAATNLKLGPEYSSKSKTIVVSSKIVFVLH